MQKLTRTSQYTGRRNTMDVNITKQELKSWQEGLGLVLLPSELTIEQAQFIMTGVTPHEIAMAWEKDLKVIDDWLSSL